MRMPEIRRFFFWHPFPLPSLLTLLISFPLAREQHLDFFNDLACLIGKQGFVIARVQTVRVVYQIRPTQPDRRKTGVQS